MPFLTTLAPSKKTNLANGKRHKTSIDWLMQMIKQVRRCLADRQLVLVVDGGLIALKLGHRCLSYAKPVTLVARFRLDVQLYDFPQEQPKGKPGPKQTAQHSRLPVTRRILQRINSQYISIEQLDKVIRDTINQYARFDLPRFWGTGKAAAADGTQFDLYSNNLLAEQHIRYGGYGGIAYHHISDTYVALFSHFINVGVWEAVYIFDGLLQNKSDIQPDTLHADTHGQSEPVFGLSHLLGIQLMPRIRN